MASTENKYQGWNAKAVVPSNTVDIEPKGCKLFIGTGGSIKVDMAGGQDAVVFKNLADGTFLPIYVDRVYAADTDATDIVQVW